MALFKVKFCSLSLANRFSSLRQISLILCFHRFDFRLLNARLNVPIQAFNIGHAIVDNIRLLSYYFYH